MQQHALIKEYLDIVFRRKWWIVGPAILGVLFAMAFYARAERKYKAETRVSIRAQTVSRALLTPIIEQNPLDLVNQITSEVKSETYVQNIEEKLRLIGTPGGPSDLAELTRMLDNQVDVNSNPRNRYFDLTVTWNDAGTASAIANEMAAIYIRRSQESRRGMASETLKKLTENREEIETKLNAKRAEVETFRGEHRYELATQQPTNLQAIQNLRAEIDRIENDIRDWRATIDTIDLQLQQPVVTAPGQVRDDSRDRLAALRRERDALLERGFTALHPSVEKLNGEIAVLERQVGQAAPDGGEAAPESADSLARAQLEQQKRRLLGDIANGRQRQQRLSGEIAQMQGRLERAPQWQIELDRLQQQLDALEDDYRDARQKESTALEGTQAEESTQGERFEILNKAIKPTRPFWPDLRLFLLMGLAVGGGLGVAAVLLLEVFDQSFKSEEQLASSIDLPLLAVIPDLARLPGKSGQRAARKPARTKAR